VKLPAWTRRLPIDAVALVVIALFVVISHVRYVKHGLCFDDPSWYFHFGHRTLDGAVPYRDYVFQVGPLPIYVDAAFQAIFGSTYAASLYAAMLITVLRVWAMWMLVRRIANWQAAALISLFCAIHPIFAVQHDWSTPYAQLFIVLAGLNLVIASTAEGRRELVHLALGGACAALVVASRQASALMIGLGLGAATVVMLVRKQYMTKTKFAALWGGYVGGLVLVFGSLAAVGALGPAIQQMFIEAPQKKGIHGIAAVLDAISGGALVDPSFHWWSGFLYWLGLPTVLVVGTIRLMARPRELDSAAVAMVALPALVVLGLAQGYGALVTTSDLPRTFLTAVAAFAVLFPERLRAWFGLEPIAALGLGALPLLSDWAMEMSFPGRGWGDAVSLTTGLLLVALASTKVTPRVKLALCGALAAIGVLHFAVTTRARYNPFAQADSGDGSLHDNRFLVHNPVVEGVKIHAARKAALEWLTSQVPAGSTCFVYGNNPVIYDLLQCANPTRLDTTAADFITENDADTAADALRAHPPDFIVAHEAAWMNPPIGEDRGGKLENYDGLNPRASRAMHMGVRTILDQYESLGRVDEHLTPDQAKFADTQRDHIGAIRVYRRRAIGH